MFGKASKVLLSYSVSYERPAAKSHPHTFQQLFGTAFKHVLLHCNGSATWEQADKLQKLSRIPDPEGGESLQYLLEGIVMLASTWVLAFVSGALVHSKKTVFYCLKLMSGLQFWSTYPNWLSYGSPATTVRQNMLCCVLHKSLNKGILYLVWKLFDSLIIWHATMEQIYLT